MAHPGWITAVLQTNRVTTRHRVTLSLLCGIIGGAVTAQANLRQTRARDFAQIWFAARAVLAGHDPYLLIGPGLAFHWNWPFLYPLPAAFIGIPFSLLTWQAASVVFFAIGAGCFAWALMEYGYAPLFGFFSAPLHYAAETAQWSPLLSASLVIPAIGFLLVAKPTVGLAYFAARPTWWAVVGGVVLGGIALALQPAWIHEWLDAIAANNRYWLPWHPYQAPIRYPGGIVVLACLLRWRRPEARLVAVLACVPQTAASYENVPLFLVPRSFAETTTLVGLSYFQHVAATLQGRDITWPIALHASGQWSVLLLYLPTTVMILRRPNEGPVPAWLEQRSASWPAWLRGRGVGAPEASI